jgi:hypothetical protein
VDRSGAGWRAGSLAEVLASILSAGTHPGKAQKSSERSAERTIKHRAHFGHSHESTPPPVTASVHSPIRHDLQPSTPPVASAPRDEPGLVSPGVDSLKPRSVQTVTVLPSPTPPAPYQEKEAPAVEVGHEELPRQADTAPSAEQVKPQIVPPAANLGTSAVPLRAGAILFGLLLLLVACTLVSISSRSPAVLRLSRRRSLRLLANIDRDSWVGRLLRRGGSAKPTSPARAGAQARYMVELTSNATRDRGDVGPAHRVIAAPAKHSKTEESALPEPTGPELEDQLARIVQDQFVVPLRKAS